MQKILCPVDFTPTSLNALEYASRLGEALKSTLTIVYVLSEDELNNVLVDGESSFEDWKTQAEDKLRNLSDQINETSIKYGLVHCDYLIKVGDLTESIVKLSEEGAFKMIVMGTGGASDLKKVYWGSNTIKVVGKSSVPVMCVPRLASFSKIAKILYATNLEKEDKEVLGQLQNIAISFDAVLQVVRVVEEDNKHEQEIFAAFSESMKSFVVYNKFRFHQVQSQDRVSVTLDKIMNEDNGDILALLTYNRNFFEKMFHQSVTKDISSFTQYPLLIFKK